MMRIPIGHSISKYNVDAPLSFGDRFRFAVHQDQAATRFHARFVQLPNNGILISSRTGVVEQIMNFMRIVLE